ncbi:sugar phosphate isomerase/epimerase [Desulfovibrio sp. OttesenSCG-928-C06]|nr:sugar phosphate isomerase/epimerase [Desulfovibrio sp. OttesenSCG-928-C06]
MTRPIGLSALSVLDVTPANQITVAAEAGFSHVGLRLIPATPTEAVHNMIGDTPMVRECERRLKDTGVKCNDIEFPRMKPDTRVINLKAFLETGARLGAKHVLVAGNDPDFNRFADNFGEFCDLAAPFGMTCNIEPMPWCDCKSLKEADKLLRAVNRANAGVCVDPIHFDRNGDTYADIAALPAGSLHYMQFTDATAERPKDVEGLLYQARNYRLTPGTGGLDLVGLLQHMPKDIPVCIECCNDELALHKSPIERAKMYLEATKKLLKQAFPND